MIHGSVKCIEDSEGYHWIQVLCAVREDDRKYIHKIRAWNSGCRHLCRAIIEKYSSSVIPVTTEVSRLSVSEV